MPRRSKLREIHLQRAARARLARHPQHSITSSGTASPSSRKNTVFFAVSDSDDKVCSWAGEVNNHGIREVEDNSPLMVESSSDEELSELERDALKLSLENRWEAIQEATTKVFTPYDDIMQPRSHKAWNKAESNRSLGYNSQSARTRRREVQKAREKAVQDDKTRKT